MYENGFCPTDDEGNRLSCPQGYGALLGTAAVCALLEILIAFIPPKILLKVVPPIVTGKFASQLSPLYHQVPLEFLIAHSCGG